MTSKAVGIDSESLLFAKLQEYSIEIHNLIFRRQYNDRRKITLSLCNTIRERIAAEIDGGEDYFCIDSKPIEVCRFARSKRCRRMMTDNELQRYGNGNDIHHAAGNIQPAPDAAWRKISLGGYGEFRP